MDRPYLTNKVSPNDIGALLVPFQKWEFKEAVFQIHSNKCTELDGFNPGCFLKISRISLVKIFFLIVCVVV